MNPIGENIPGICLHLEDTTNKNLLEALIVTGGSASCFGEQYRDLLLYLPQMLDEKNSNQQVHTAVQQYIQYRSHVASKYFLPNLVIPLLLFANKEMSSTERRTEGGIADETYMPSLKCGCFGSAA